MTDMAAALRAWEQGDLAALAAWLAGCHRQHPDRFGDIVAQLLMVLARRAGPGAADSLVQGLLDGASLTPAEWQACLTALEGQDVLSVAAIACLSAGMTVPAAYPPVLAMLFDQGRFADAAALAAQALVLIGIDAVALRPVWQPDVTPALIGELEQLLPPVTEAACLRLVELLDDLGAGDAADAWLAGQLTAAHRGNRTLLVRLVQRRAEPDGVTPSLLSALERIVAEDGENMLAARVLAEQFGQLGRYGDAIAGIETALARRPDDGHLWFALGYLLSFRRHDAIETVRAITAFERARDLGLDDGPTRMNLCLLYREVGRESECWSLLRTLPADRVISYWPRFSSWPAPAMV